MTNRSFGYRLYAICVFAFYWCFFRRPNAHKRLLQTIQLSEERIRLYESLPNLAQLLELDATNTGGYLAIKSQLPRVKAIAKCMEKKKSFNHLITLDAIMQHDLQRTAILNLTSQTFNARHGY